jgi:hypothetical protein
MIPSPVPLGRRGLINPSPGGRGQGRGIVDISTNIEDVKALGYYMPNHHQGSG